MTIELIASRTSAGDTCSPDAPLAFDLPGAGTLPVIVDVMPGATYGNAPGSWIGYRVTWLLDATVVARDTGYQVFPPSGALEVQLALTGACRNVPCPDGQRCRDGACTGSYDPFDAALRDPAAQSCSDDAR